jgi:tripartite-type tricarboxylate transporter receptor subunit TctC
MKKIGSVIAIFCYLFVFTRVQIGMAADFPQKPIRMIVPWSQGGGNDVLARAFQPTFEKALGQRILIDNIPAGTTKVGTIELMKAKPDGYTLIISTTESWLGYYYSGTFETKVLDQMTPLGIVASEPYGYVETKIDSPYKTWADVVKAAKENPGKLTCGSSGSGGMLEMIMTDISKASGIKTPRIVPFAGSGPSVVALLGGHTDLRVGQVSASKAMYSAGKTRGLAISTDKRLESHPDVPTFKELGIGGTIVLTRSIWGPPNLPPNLVNTITKMIEKATKDAAFIKILYDQLSQTVDYRPPQTTREYVDNFDKEYGPRLAETFK